MVDAKSRPKQKHGYQDDAKIVDFFLKRKKIEEEERSGLQKKWEAFTKKFVRCILLIVSWKFKMRITY